MVGQKIGWTDCFGLLLLLLMLLLLLLFLLVLALVLALVLLFVFILLLLFVLLPLLTILRSLFIKCSNLPVQCQCQLFHNLNYSAVTGRQNSLSLFEFLPSSFTG